MFQNRLTGGTVNINYGAATKIKHNKSKNHTSHISFQKNLYFSFSCILLKIFGMHDHGSRNKILLNLSRSILFLVPCAKCQQHGVSNA